MSSQSLTRQQRGYAVSQLADSQTPAVLTGTSSFLFTKLMLDRHVADIKRTDITGLRQNAPSLKGRVSGTWSVDANLIGSGIAIQPPDIDALLAGTFGQPATIGASSVTYSLSDAISTFTLGRYRTPSTITQHLGVGCVVKTTEFALGQDLATIKCSGDAVMVLDNDLFGTMPTPEKMTLAAFPAEPVGRIVHGTACVGFRGSLMLDGQPVATLRNMTIKVATGNEIVLDTFGSEFGTGTLGDVRVVSASFSLYDSDDAATADLKTKAWTFAPITAVAIVGNTVGNTWTFSMAGIILKDLKYDDSTKRWSIAFGESEAFSTSLTALDALSIVIS